MPDGILAVWNRRNPTPVHNPIDKNLFYYIIILLYYYITMSSSNLLTLLTNKPQLQPSVTINMTLATGTNSGTTDNIIFRWIYTDLISRHINKKFSESMDSPRKFSSIYYSFIDRYYSFIDNISSTNVSPYIYNVNTGFSNYITLATAPLAGASIIGTFTPNQPISGIQITCSGNDGFEMAQLSFNGTNYMYTNDLGWIDLNSTNGYPAYNNYPYAYLEDL